MESLPPPPDTIPHNVIPMKVEQVQTSKRLPLARRGIGTKGQRVQLLANHFRVGVSKTEGYFYHYSVCPLSHHFWVVYIASLFMIIDLS